MAQSALPFYTHTLTTYPCFLSFGLVGAKYSWITLVPIATIMPSLLPSLKPFTNKSPFTTTPLSTSFPYYGNQFLNKNLLFSFPFK